jgi:5,10-methylenetetrahydromethanopterin reductase
MLRFGFGAVPEAGLDDSVRLARLGESLGYDTAWMPDQTFFRDPFVVLTVCAQATEHIRLMLGVTNPFTRHPVQVARAVATIDEVSGGRLSLAYGAGNRKELLLPLGMEQTSAGPRCREAAVVTKRLLSGEQVHYRSDTLVVDGVRLLTPPRPGLPIYLAGRGPYILKAAGQVADGAIIGGLVSPAGLGYAIGLVRDGAGSQKRDLKDVDIVWWGSVYLTDDRSKIVDNLKSSVAHIIGGAPLEVLQTIGLSDERIKALKLAYSAGGPAGAAPLVTDAEIDLLTIAGDAEHCAAKMAQLQAVGVKQVGILLNQPTPKEQEEFLSRFAREVMPHFREGRHNEP